MFLAALSAILLSFLWLDFSWLALIFLLLLLVRILFMKRPAILVINLVFCLFFSVAIVNFKDWTQKSSYNSQTKIQGQLEFYADQVKINGNLLMATATCPQLKQRVQVYYLLKTAAEKEWWLTNIENVNVDFTGKISKINPPTNENEFDYQRFNQGKRIVNSIYIQNLTDINLKRQGVLGWLHHLRRKVQLRLASLPAPLKNYAAVLVIGYQPQEFGETLAKIRELGLLYLFCLSGLHVFYVVALLKILCKKLWITQETTRLLIIIVLPVYALLGGNSVSLLRAVGMVFLTNLLKLVGVKNWSSISSWSVVSIGNLFFSPAIVFSLGAQLSYLLTLIILLAPKISDWKLNVYLNLFSLPLILWQTYKWNLLTMLLTILIMPLFEWILLPSVIIGIILAISRPLCNLLLRLSDEIFRLLANLPTEIIFGKPQLFFVCLWLGSTLSLLVVKKHRALLVVALVCSYLSCFLIIHFPLKGEVVYFDIGQGDATLVRDPFNKTVSLIDTGGKITFTEEKWQQRTSKTKGQTIIANYLLSKGIGKIDQLILTHQDTDHVGNFPSLSHEIQIKAIYVPAGMENLASFKKRLASADLVKTKVFPIIVGATANLKQFQLLHPILPGNGTNECSLVLWYNFNQTSCLFMGDLDKQNELALLARYPQLQATVLKAGHHGSKTSSDSRFVAKVNPSLVIISAGRHNRYGHPHLETITTLKQQGIPYLVTAQTGMIKLRTGFTGVRVQNFAQMTGQNNFISQD